MNRRKVIDVSEASCTEGGHVAAVRTREGAKADVHEWRVADVWAAIYEGHVFFMRNVLPHHEVRILATDYCGCGCGTLRTVSSRAERRDISSSVPLSRIDSSRHCSSRGR